MKGAGVACSSQGQQGASCSSGDMDRLFVSIFYPSSWAARDYALHRGRAMFFLHHVLRSLAVSFHSMCLGMMGAHVHVARGAGVSMSTHQRQCFISMSTHHKRMI